MKRKALHKEFRMEVKKTFARFLSILLIVALGVAFFSGLRACKKDMLLSADDYYDEYHLMDLYLLGSYGFTNEDVEALLKLPEITNVEPAYTQDVIVQNGQEDIVVRTYSNTTRVNCYALCEGRNIQNINECIVDTAFLEKTGYRIGDTITMTSTDDKMSELFEETKVIIVGSCNDPRYMSFSRGNSTLGNGTVSSFIVLDADNYKQNAYSELYLTVSDSTQLSCFSNEYIEKIEHAKGQILEIQETQCKERYDSLTKKDKELLEKSWHEYDTAVEQLEKNKIAIQEQFKNQDNVLLTSKENLDAAIKQLEDKKAALYAIHYGEEDVNRMLSTYINDIATKTEEYDKAYKALEQNKQEVMLGLKQKEETLQSQKELLTQSQSKLDAVKQPQWYLLDRTCLESYVSYQTDADRIEAIANVFPVIFFLVAALVCLTTMTRMVEEERTEIGTLKAIGYSSYSIAAKYLKYAFAATVSGTIIGVLLGQKIFPFVVINAYRILYTTLPHIHMVYQFNSALIAGMIAIVCTLLVTLFTCLGDLQQTPAQLMRPKAPRPGKRIILEKISFIWNRIKFTQKSTLRNLFRYKKRFFMTVIGIGLCMALMMVGFGLKDSIGVIAKLQYKDLWLQDAQINLKAQTTEAEQQSMVSQLSTLDGIRNAGLVYQKTVDTSYADRNKEVSLIVTDEANAKEFYCFRSHNSKETYELNNEGVIITKKYATMLGIKVGDLLTISLGEERSAQVKVTAITENYLFHYVYMTDDCYQQLFGQEAFKNTILLKYNENNTIKESDLMTSLLSKYDHIMAISTTRTLEGRVNDIIKGLNIIVYVLIVSAGLLAFIVLYNLTNINVNERKKELASLKVLGFFDREVNSYVMRETMILTVIGIFLGMVLGYFLHGFVIVTCEVDMVMFGHVIYPISYVYSGILTFLFSLVICFFMYFKLKKIDMIASLKSVE